MGLRRPLVWLWLVLGVMVAGMIAGLWGPMHSAWTCYLMHEQGQRAEAELVEQLDDGKLVLQLKTGPQAGQTCTTGSVGELRQSAGDGEPILVVYFENRPGDCVLQSTLQASGIVLWVLTGGFASVALLLLGVTLLIHRSYTRPGLPKRRMEVDPSSVACPACGAKMAEGYLALLAGVHWREPGSPVGLPHALGGLPGTVGWRGRPLLHAFRCGTCEVVSFQYGRPPAGSS